MDVKQHQVHLKSLQPIVRQAMHVIVLLALKPLINKVQLFA